MNQPKFENTEVLTLLVAHVVCIHKLLLPRLNEKLTSRVSFTVPVVWQMS